ncbi:hypothetical protein L2E82_01555 [Cichorium intybus]|uniref:Uncharacterized protein n=1 Tax=Cichorium intybus TaxID=13427 RepID=A0ACB9GZB4_CICIN|nr:hypothetical protein L2E82_01555 [Cichorium intybus]
MMKMYGMITWFMKLSILSMLLMALDTTEAQKQLKLGFYRTTCPAAEKIVRDTVSKAVTANPGMAAGILRLYFHDCFVRGCDASLLLKTVPKSASESEQDAGPNAGTLRGLEIIDQAKAKLETACPNTVSCADILAFAARDSTNIVGGFSYAIPSGRRDGRVSNIDEVDLPSPSFDLNTLKKTFMAKGLSVGDMVALSGAHSIGRAGCNFVASNPSLDPTYAKAVKSKCRKSGNSGTTNLDPVSANRLDSQYYLNVKQHKVLFSSDQSLLDSKFTATLVTKYSRNLTAWRNDFAAAMIRLGSLDVLTGTKGEIRKRCGVRN